MVLQAGVFYVDGRSATSDDLRTILGEFDAWDAETAGEVFDGPLCMAYRSDRINYEEDNDVQPVEVKPFTLTWDGRLDNRADIATRLGITSVAEIPDSKLVAKAYERFGPAIFQVLVGEFALTLWTQHIREIVFVRSVCGARCLYYVQDKNRLVWSSDFAHLVRTTKVDLAVSEPYLLEYLVSQPNAQRTPLINVHAVPAGTALRFANATVQSAVKLWDPYGIKPIRYASDRQFEEELREKLGEAVSLRMRAKSCVFAELSGGLDSSSLVLTADLLSRASGQALDRLKTFSCRYEESESCDEGYFIRQVEEARGVGSCYVHEKDQQVTLGLHDVCFTGLPSPLHCYPGRYRAYASVMRAHGARVLLTGEGGDHLFWSILDGAPVIADEIHRGNFVRALQECGVWSRFTGSPYLTLLLGQAIPLAFRSVFGRTEQYQPPAVPDWLSESWKKRFREMVWDAVAPPGDSGSPGFRAHLRLVEALFAQVSAGYLAEHRDIYVSHPYTHRPLVEFCLATPISQHLRDGHARSLMRRAFADRLPPKVLHRKSKGSLEEPLARALEKEFPSVGSLSGWQVCQRGIADPKQLGQAMNAMKLGLQAARGGNFIRVFSLERWLRSLDCVASRKRREHALAS